MIYLVLAAGLGGLGVILGAFGAHALRDTLDAERLAIFETGVRYQMYHALALVAVAWLVERRPDQRAARLAGLLFVTGVGIFSGSLYALALSGVRWLGAITPIGGVAFILEWGALALAAYRAR